MQGNSRIGYLVPQFPGQTHAFFWREIRALERAGVEVVLYSTRRPPPGIVAHDWSAEAASRTEYLARRDPISTLRALPALPWAELAGAEPGLLRDFTLSLGAARTLVTSARRHGLRHVHVHSCGRAALIAALAQRLGGPSYSLTLHNPFYVYGPGQRFKWRQALFATVVNRNLVSQVQTTLGKDAPPRVVVQPMGVDTERFRRATPFVPAQPGETVRLFSCGRLNPVKGHQDLLAALRILLDQGFDATLAIAGEDEEGGTGFRRVIEGRIAELGLTRHVQLLGAVDEERVKQEIMAAHVFILASHDEGVPVALMEAMACGAPVIGTAVGGVRELVTDGVDGIVLEPREPVILARAIQLLAASPSLALKLALAGRTRVEREFDSARGAETLIREIGLTPTDAAPALSLV
jgi:glycosyltransferase involved in cell wall biosynthesis